MQRRKDQLYPRQQRSEAPSAEAVCGTRRPVGTHDGAVRGELATAAMLGGCVLIGLRIV